MANKQQGQTNAGGISAGQVYKFHEDSYRPESTTGAKYYRVIGGNANGVRVELGKLIGSDTFVSKAFKGDDGTPVRQISISADVISASTFLFNQPMEITDKMTNEDNKTDETELTYEMDTDGAASDDSAAQAKPKKLTPQEQIDKIAKDAKEKAEAVKKAAKEKEAAVKQREADKAAAATKKRVDKLTGLLEPTGLTESEAASIYSDVKKFEKMEAPACELALTGLKTIAKNVKTLRQLASDLGLGEPDAITAHGKSGVDGIEFVAVKKFGLLSDADATATIEAMKTAKKDAAKNQAVALLTNLTDDEAKERIKVEKEIFRILPQAQMLQAQLASCVAIISDQKLYRSTHKSLEAYMLETFDLSRPQAYALISASRTYQALTEGEKLTTKQLPSINAAMAITSGVNNLLKEANLSHDPELKAITQAMARNVYDLAASSAPVDKDGKPILAPAHLSSVFTVLGEVARTGVVDLGDGTQVPMNIAAASIDAAITDESVERVARAKAYLAEQFTSRAAASAEARKNGDAVSGAIDRVTSDPIRGNGASIPAGVIPKLIVTCTVHGRVELSGSTEQDVDLGCGCVFLSTAEGYVWEKNTREASVDGEAV